MWSGGSSETWAPVQERLLQPTKGNAPGERQIGDGAVLEVDVVYE